jgi:hypothetical protein
VASPQARHRKPARLPVTHSRPSVPAAGPRHRKLPGTVAPGLPAVAGLPVAMAGLPAAATRHRRPSALQNKSARATALTALAMSAAATAAVTHWPAGTAGHPAATGAGAMSALSTKPGAIGGRPLAAGPSGQTAAFGVPRPVGIYRPAAISLNHPQLPQPKGKHHRPAAVAPSSGHPPLAASSPPSAYSNPLRAVSGLIPERVDMGVDFGGSGPVYPLGDAVVTSATGSSSGWPGGGWITYRLTSGPDAGLVVYVAEDVQPAVAVGQVVTPSTVIATMYNGGTGIETGWAMPNGASAESQLPEAGGIGGGGPFPTMIGLSFENLLHGLGVPASPAGGSGYGILPPGYPAG